MKTDVPKHELALGSEGLKEKTSLVTYVQYKKALALVPTHKGARRAGCCFKPLWAPQPEGELFGGNPRCPSVGRKEATLTTF